VEKACACPERLAERHESAGKVGDSQLGGTGRELEAALSGYRTRLDPAVSRNSSVPQSALEAVSGARDIRISGRRSSSVNRIRPDTFSSRIRFASRRYSFWRVSS